MQLNQHKPLFDLLQVERVAITVDKSRDVKEFVQEHGISYPILYDKRGRIARKLTIRNRDYRPGDQAYGVPHPGVMYIGPDGTILGKIAMRGYKKRPTMQAIANMILQVQQAQGWSAPEISNNP